MSEQAPSRRWPRYLLQMLFVAVTLLCVWIGWQVTFVRQRQAMRLWIRERDGYVNQCPQGREFAPIESGKSYDIPRWRYWLRDKAAWTLYLPVEATQDDIKRARSLFPECANVSQFLEPPNGTIPWPAMFWDLIP